MSGLKVETEELKLAEQLIREEVGLDSPKVMPNPWYYAVRIPISLKDPKKHLAEVELIPMGEWKHPDAIKGAFKVTEELLGEFVQNFTDGVVGDKLPLDYDHHMDSKSTPGWIIGMSIKANDRGGKSIFAKMDITDPETQQKIKEGSLSFISPEFWIGWDNPENGKKYNIIRAAGLTNYPFIKNMKEIRVLNFTDFEIYNERRNIEMADDPKVDDPKVDPKVDDPKVDDPKVDPKADDPKDPETPDPKVKTSDTVQMAMISIDIAKADDASLKSALDKIMAELEKRKVPEKTAAVEPKAEPVKVEPKVEVTEAEKAAFSANLDKLVEGGRLSPAQVEKIKGDVSIIKMSEGKAGEALLKVLEMNEQRIITDEITLKDDSSVKIKYSDLDQTNKAKFLKARAEKVAKETGQPFDTVVHELANQIER